MAVFPAVSVATAERVCDPFVVVVVFHDRVYKGPAPVTTLPRAVPSTSNCTPDIPALDSALAATVMVPVTVAPIAGAVTKTAGVA